MLGLEKAWGMDDIHVLASHLKGGCRSGAAQGAQRLRHKGPRELGSSGRGVGALQHT